MGGSCSSGTTSASVGSNTITLDSLADGTYSNCTITVTDAASNTSNVITVTTFTVDTTAPTISETTTIGTTFTIDPEYTFTSDEAGTITYGGDCSSATTNANSGSNTITFEPLSINTHSNCTIVVTDATNNASNTLNVTSFQIVQSTGGISYTPTYTYPPIATHSQNIYTQTKVKENEVANNKEVKNNDSKITQETTHGPCPNGAIYNPWTGEKCIKEIFSDNTNQPDKNLAETNGVKDKITDLNKKQICPTMPSLREYGMFVIMRGDTGEIVKILQEVLNCKGYVINQSGSGSMGNETIHFGRLTENQVFIFQKENGLIMDGIVGDETWRKLNNL